MGQRLEMRLLLRLRQHVQVSVVLFADMDICSPFGISGQLFFWQIWVSVVLLAVASVVWGFGEIHFVGLYCIRRRLGHWEAVFCLILWDFASADCFGIPFLPCFIVYNVG